MSAIARVELLAQLRAGDSASLDQAVEALFRAHHRQVLALCRHLTGDPADAEDALQETFLAARTALPSFRGEAQVSTWLCRIAIRVALRVKSKRPAVAEPLESASEHPGEHHARRDALVRALEALSAEQRVVIALFAVEGLTHAEIAAILGIPEGTVWSRLHGAKRRLAQLLRE